MLALQVTVAVVLSTSAHAQNFVRVTDPTNPIVADRRQSGGGFFVDLVGDGYLDLFVANGNLSNEPNALYRNLRQGGFVRVTTGAVVNDGGSSIGGTFGDFDHDGRLDLFVTNRANFGNFLYRGLGDTLFAKTTTGSPVTDIANSNMSSWVDYDRDGNLDLHVVNFSGNDFLYRNSGPPSFTLARIDTTAITSGAEFSIPGAWADVNGDGFDDLFVGNAGGQNDYVYRNQGGGFFTRAVLADGLSTLGGSFGDYDNDGHLDLVVAHYQGQTNTLYHNAGAPSFTLTPVASAVSSAAGSWVGTAWGDYDNDGALDLFVAQDGGSSALFRNGGPPGYALTRILTGPVATDAGNAFGAAWGDYDRDGQLDLFVTDRLANGNRLYHNQGNANHWLTVRCAGTASNRTGIGARVRVDATIGGVTRRQLREVTSQTGYNSGNLDQHFGLGDAAVADSVVIEWPSGRRDTWASMSVDTLVVLTEGTGVIAVEPQGAGVVRRLRLAAPAPNPCDGELTLSFELPRASRARIELFDLSGRQIATVADRWLAAGTHRARVEVPAVAAGVYFVRVSAGAERATVRFVRVR